MVSVLQPSGCHWAVAAAVCAARKGRFSHAQSGRPGASGVIFAGLYAFPVAGLSLTPKIANPIIRAQSKKEEECA